MLQWLVCCFSRISTFLAIIIEEELETQLEEQRMDEDRDMEWQELDEMEQELRERRYNRAEEYESAEEYELKVPKNMKKILNKSRL